MATKASRRRANESRTRAELVTLAISLLVLLALVGGIVWLDLRGGDDPARITTDLQFTDAYEHDGDGDRAADVLQVDIVRPIEGEQPETSTLEYAFVAGGEQVAGTAVFDEEPTPDTIEVDVLTITEP
jgi:uncharacterized protein (TIGR02588 family)